MVALIRRCFSREEVGPPALAQAVVVSPVVVTDLLSVEIVGPARDLLEVVVQVVQLVSRVPMEEEQAALSGEQAAEDPLVEQVTAEAVRDHEAGAVPAREAATEQMRT